MIYDSIGYQELDPDDALSGSDSWLTGTQAGTGSMVLVIQVELSSRVQVI